VLFLTQRLRIAAIVAALCTLASNLPPSASAATDSFGTDRRVDAPTSWSAVVSGALNGAHLGKERVAARALWRQPALVAGVSIDAGMERHPHAVAGADSSADRLRARSLRSRAPPLSPHS
jgi:hypothetical protein